MKTIRIDGIIGDWLNTVEEFINRVNMLGLENDEPLTVIINSQGGSVFEGFGIYNYLVSLPNEIHTEIEGLAASISTLIAASAKKENSSISEIAMYMIHKASVGAMGNSEELEKQVDVLKSIDETLITVYTSRTGKTRKQIENLMSDETWFTGPLAVKEGFIGNLINRVDAKAAAMAQQTQIQNNMNYFKNLLTKYSNSGDQTPEEKAAADALIAKAAAEKAETPEAIEAARVAALTPEEIEAERVAALTTEEVEAERVAAEALAASAVTPEMFAALQASVNQLSQMVRETVTALAQQVPVDEQVKTAFTAQLKNLPTSKGNPSRSPSTITQTQNGYKPKNSAHKNRMKEIEEKTRLS